MRFPRVYFPDKEIAEKVLDLSDPCGGRLYVSTFISLASAYLHGNRAYVPRLEQIYDEFFITQKEYDNARIVFDRRTGCYRIDFQDDNCYWDSSRFYRGAPKYQVEDMAIELGLHYDACRRVEEARSKENPRPIYYVDEERLARARSIAEAEAAYIAEGGISMEGWGDGWCCSKIYGYF